MELDQLCIMLLSRSPLEDYSKPHLPKLHVGLLHWKLVHHGGKLLFTRSVHLTPRSSAKNQGLETVADVQKEQNLDFYFAGPF